MKIESISSRFQVRTLGTDDLDSIYSLSCENETFYRYHPPFVTKESILEDMLALPSGKSYDDKFYIGYFNEDQLIALMDLILDYPSDGTAFIGLFMMKKEFQGKGIGSSIISECISCLRKEGFISVQLGTDKENPQSNAFWSKNHFSKISEQNEYIIRERML